LQKSNLLDTENELNIELKNFRPLNEAKVSSGGVSMDEIKPNFESKQISNLYFI
jgi:predicted flavoprotein YhiN